MAPASELLLPLASEQKLIEKAHRGDRFAAAALVERHWDRLYRWLFHVTHDQRQAEQLARSALLTAIDGLEALEPGSPFKPWLFRIAYNLFLRRNQERRIVRQRIPQTLALSSFVPLTRKALLALTRAVGRLPTDFRTVYLLRAEEGMTFREVAEVVDLEEEEVRSRIYRARQKLLQVLGPYLEQNQL